MGLFKSIGKIAGAAVGFATGGLPGAAKGYKVGGKIGGGVDSVTGKKKKKGGYIPAPPTADELGIDFSLTRNQTSGIVSNRDPTKVAQTVDITDPWRPAKDWWEDMGGDRDEIEQAYNRMQL